MALGDICFQKTWKGKNVKESCKLQSDIYHVALLTLSLILLSILSFKNNTVTEI